jgi:hypothetical protein
MNTALAELTPEPRHEEPADPPEDEAIPDGTVNDEAKTPEGEEGEGETPEAKAAREAAEAAETPEEKAAREAAAAAEAAKPKAPEAKKPDALNDPIPKELAQETQVRIRTLIKTAKEAEQRVQEAQQQLDGILGGLQAAGATPQQYGEVVSWLSLFNSPDPQNQTKALELAEQVVDRLSALLGRERPSADPLAGMDDLKNAVKAGQMTQQWANQMAVQRRQQQTRQQLEQSRTQTQTQEQQREQEMTQAKTDLNALEAELKASDPQYTAKKALLVDVLKPLFSSIPPSQWAAKFREAYKTVRIGSAASALAASRTRPAVPVAQPLRTKSASVGGKAPKNVGEAIDAALADLGSRR